MEGEFILVKSPDEQATGWAPEYDDGGGWYDPEERGVIFDHGRVVDRRS